MIAHPEIPRKCIAARRLLEWRLFRSDESIGCTGEMVAVMSAVRGIALTWLGHSTFKVTSAEGKTLLIDPWVAGNPSCPESEKYDRSA